MQYTYKMMTNQSDDNPDKKNYNQEKHIGNSKNLVYNGYTNEAKENINTQKYKENCD